MESIYTELALYGSKNGCARTATIFLPISEVCLNEEGVCRTAPATPGLFKKWYNIRHTHGHCDLDSRD